MTYTLSVYKNESLIRTMEYVKKTYEEMLEVLAVERKYYGPDCNVVLELVENQ